MNEPMRIAVTGAAGQIGYALLFRIAAGGMLGRDQPVILQLLEIPPAMSALQGVVMELEDCAFPLLHGVVQTDSPDEAFTDVDIAILVGSRPRGPGMERGELLEANGAIFTVQGRSINSCASKDVKVLVVGNPANTNCLIALRSAPDLDPSQFSAMTRLDHNRAVAQLSQKANVPVDAISDLAVWGNHSPTMFPDLLSTKINGDNAMNHVDMDWYESEFIPAIQQRGATIIAARGSSSAASAANAAAEHVRDWVLGTNEITSMAINSSGDYGIEKGIVFSFPVTCSDGKIHVVRGRELDEFCKSKLAITEAELLEERAAIEHLL